MKRILIGLLFVVSSVQAENLTYQVLTDIIRNQKITTIETLLSHLPTEFRSNYALMYESRSLQEASFQNPRVILYGSNAKLTCTFNGTPTQKGFDTLECFQFDDRSRNFDFRQIQFPTLQNGLHEVRFSKSNSSADGKTSCTACHASDPRPNWDGYDRWPGAYGSEDDQLSKVEKVEFQHFNQLRPSHPRYRWLGDQSFNNFKFSDAATRLNTLRTRRIMEGKLKKWQNLAFATRALNCKVSPEQIKLVQNSGLGFGRDYGEEDRTYLFNQLNMRAYDFNTQIFNDPQFVQWTDPPWEHSSGIALQSDYMAMATIQDMAHAGDSIFQHGLGLLEKYWADRYSTALSNPDQHNVDYDAFIISENKIVPDVDHEEIPNYNNGWNERQSWFCPRLVELFIKEYVAGN